MNNRSIGHILFCIWGVVFGATALIPALTFPLLTPLLAILLIFSCLLMLFGR